MMCKLKVSVLSLALLASVGLSLHAQGRKLPPPFNQPFQVQFAVTERFANSSWSSPTNTSYDTSTVMNVDSMTVYPRDSDYYIPDSLPRHPLSIRFFSHNDTLHYEQVRYAIDNYQSKELVEIVFDSTKPGVIAELRYDLTYSSILEYGHNAVSLRDLRFDSIGIFLTDLDYSSHVTGVESQGYWSDLPIGWSNRLLSVSSIDLSGIFRPTHLVGLASVAKAAAPSSISFFSNNGVIECAFDPADHFRTFEFYSPLGVRISALEIAPEQHSVTLPKLPNGLYFIRLGETLVKVSVSE